MDLEARLDQAHQDLKSGVRPGRDKAMADDRALPRAPAKAVLTGHRNPLTCIALHPLYSVAASTSEDATVKVTFARTNWSCNDVTRVVGSCRACICSQVCRNSQERQIMWCERRRLPVATAYLPQ